MPERSVQGFAAAGPATAATPWLRDDRHALVPTILAWTLIVLMIVPDGFDYAALATSKLPAEGSALSRLLWLGLLAAAATVVLRRAALGWLLLRWLNPFLPMFAALAFASVAWSIEPTVTVRRMIRVTTILLAAFAVVLAGWHERRLQELLRPIITLMLAGSIAFGLLWPQYAIHPENSYELAGAWRGLTSHKNSLGALACIGLILWFHAWLAREVRPTAALAGGAVAAACVLLSRSSTSLMTALFALCALALMQRARPALRPFIPYAAGLFVVLLLGYALIVMQLLPGISVLLKPVAALTGKDLSFTGRSDIWRILSEQFRQHPLLGTGYGAYWNLPTLGSPSYVFMERMQFYPASAHNGYLEIINELGAVGFLCLVGYLIVHVRQAVCLAQLELGQGALYLALFLQQAIGNLSESHWLNALSVHFVLASFASTALARTLLEYRLRLYFGEPNIGGARGAAERRA